ncbi:MAG: aminoacyl-tRNA hydrolase [Kofleriaceae bacterium]
MWMVAGLGNPGPKYARNRHNIGFRVVDALAQKHALPEWKRGKLGGDSTTGQLTTATGRTKVLLVKPMEFMNLSGFAVQRFLDFHHVPLDHLVVVHDEIDLDFGLVRLKSGGGHGGNNGMRSILAQLGDGAFTRIRVGVGKPGPQAGKADGGAAAARAQGVSAAANKDVSGWVLGDFPAAQAHQVDAMVDAAIEAIEAVTSVGVAKAMNQLNGRPSVAAGAA